MLGENNKIDVINNLNDKKLSEYLSTKKDNKLCSFKFKNLGLCNGLYGGYYNINCYSCHVTINIYHKTHVGTYNLPIYSNYYHIQYDLCGHRITPHQDYDDILICYVKPPIDTEYFVSHKFLNYIKELPKKIDKVKLLTYVFGYRAYSIR